MEPTRKKSLKLNPKFLKGINKNSVVLLDNYGNNSTKLLKSKWNNTQIGTTSLAQQFFFHLFTPNTFSTSGNKTFLNIFTVCTHNYSIAEVGMHQKFLAVKIYIYFSSFARDGNK